MRVEQIAGVKCQVIEDTSISNIRGFYSYRTTTLLTWEASRQE